MRKDNLKYYNKLSNISSIKPNATSSSYITHNSNFSSNSIPSVSPLKIEQWLRDVENTIQQIKSDVNNPNYTNSSLLATRITDLESKITLMLHEIYKNNDNNLSNNGLEDKLQNMQKLIENIREEMKSVFLIIYLFVLESGI